MNKILLAFLILFANNITGQSLGKMPDSVRRLVDEYNSVTGKNTINKKLKKVVPGSEDDIKEKLIDLVLRNTQIKAANANITIAEIARKKANSSLLSSVNLGGNLNEFVISNSQLALFTPKYNLGVSIPMDVFAKAKAEKKTADQVILINTAQKEQLEIFLKAKVLTQYENYKEAKAQVEFQKIAMEDDVAAYEAGQKNFKDDVISLEDLNKIYKSSISEKGFLASKQRNLNIAIIELEQTIGVKLNTIIFDAN